MCRLLFEVRMKHWAAMLIVILFSGCTSMYFQTLDEVPAPAPPAASDWPWQEYWTGLIFNGEKIGFTHQQFVPEQDRFRISSEAALHFHFLFVEKEFAAITHDWVNADLQLERFDYTYKIDNSRRTIKGEVTGNQLMLEVRSRGRVDTKILPVEGELVPMNAIYLYPVMRGLQVGKVFNYRVFNGETLAIHPVEQAIVAYQASELFDEKAFKVETEVLGVSTTTWIDASGLPQFELSLRGTLISALEPETYAKRYLTQAALSKSEHLLTYSLIPAGRVIESPRSLLQLDVRITGVPDGFELMDSSMQQCRRGDGRWDCSIRSDRGAAESTPVQPASYTVHDTLPSFTVNSTAGEIVRLARDITPATDDPGAQVLQILDWLDRNIEKDIVDSYNALDVLAQRKAECQGHSLLFAALARSLGIPTRLLNGVVYSQEHEAFLYHTWVESHIDNRWQAIDPTFGQRHADATHIALIEGEELADLAVLLPMIGRLGIELY